MNHKMKKVLRAMLLVLAMTLMYSINVPAATKVQASIGKKGYATLEKALAAVKDGQTITLKKDITLKKALKFNKNARYAFNMNKHTLTNDFLVDDEEGGTLEIHAGNVTITNGTLKGGICVYENAQLTVKNGTYAQINNYGTTTINNGKITNPTYSAILNMKGTMVINKVTAAANYNCIYAKSGTVTVNGGTYRNLNMQDNYPLVYSEKATVVLNNGTYNATSMSTVYNLKGRITIKGGTYTSNGTGAATVWNLSSMSIKGGTFKKTGGGIVLDCDRNSRTVILGGTLSSEGTVMMVNSPRKKLLINGGTLQTFSDSDPVIMYAWNTDNIKLDQSKVNIIGGGRLMDEYFN